MNKDSVWVENVREKFLGHVVLVRWLDANSSGDSWVSLDKFKPRLAACLSVGFLVQVDEDTLALFCDLTADRSNGSVEVQGNPAITIPLCQVQDVFSLSEEDYIRLCYNNGMEENHA